MPVRRLRSFLASLALTFALTACQGAAPVPEAATIAQATAFLGVDLPAGARDVHIAQEHGMDRLMLLRLDAPVAAADAFARSLTGKTPLSGMDPGLGYLGKSLPWWTNEAPTGSSGLQATTAGGLNVKLLIVPQGTAEVRVYLAAFSS